MQTTSMFLAASLLVLGLADDASGQNTSAPVLRVKRVDDFSITGDGSAEAWKKTTWTPLKRRGASDGDDSGGDSNSQKKDYTARFKILYSEKGVYLLMDAADRKLTASFEKDFENLWTEDVFEAFFWTDERYPIYFEYEISPLEKELPIIIPNFDGKFYGWRPWHYEGERKTSKAVKVQGGPQKSGAAIRGWTAEIFFPYDLFKPLQNVPPKPGTRWRANFYRVDHDGGERIAWDWARVGPSFHEYQKYGTLIFE